MWNYRNKLHPHNMLTCWMCWKEILRYTIRAQVPIAVYAALILACLGYILWLVNAYHNPPLACYLTGCHFTLLGWER